MCAARIRRARGQFVLILCSDSIKIIIIMCDCEVVGSTWIDALWRFHKHAPANMNATKNRTRTVVDSRTILLLYAIKNENLIIPSVRHTQHVVMVISSSSINKLLLLFTHYCLLCWYPIRWESHDPYKCAFFPFGWSSLDEGAASSLHSDRFISVPINAPVIFPFMRCWWSVGFGYLRQS